MRTASASVKHADRNYVIQCAAVMGIYMLVLWMRPWLAAHTGGHIASLAATLLPIAPIWLMLAVVWRYYLRIDEYKQKRMLEVLSLTFGFGACIIVSYGFLMDAGLPKIGYDWAWPILGITWAAVSLVHEATHHG